MTEYFSFLTFLLFCFSIVIIGRWIIEKYSYFSKSKPLRWSPWKEYLRCPDCDTGWVPSGRSDGVKGVEATDYCYCGSHYSKMVKWVGQFADKDKRYWNWLPEEKMVLKLSDKEREAKAKAELEVLLAETKAKAELEVFLKNQS